MSSLLCKWFIVGDSLAVGLGGYLPHANSDHTHVGASVHKIEKIMTDKNTKFELCDNTVISLGSNVLFNNFDKEIKRYSNIIMHINIIADPDTLYLMPVPAKGKYAKRAADFNNRLKNLADEWKSVKYLPLPTGLQNEMSSDNIHVGHYGMLMWKRQLEKDVENSSFIPGRGF